MTGHCTGQYYLCYVNLFLLCDPIMNVVVAMIIIF